MNADILDKILKFADKPTLVCCSTVNEYWSHGANKYLWQSLSSLRPLLELLAPLTNVNNRQPMPEFKHGKPISWGRFNVHAPLVKYLSISESKDRYGKSVLSTVALWRPSISLLPRLQELHIDFRENSSRPQGYLLDFAMVLLGEDITHISLSIGSIGQISTLCGDGYSTFLAFLDAIPCRTPFLRRFSLDCLSGDNICNVVDGQDLTGISECIRNLLPSLHKIETIEFCPRFASMQMTATLFYVTSLKTLKLRCNQYHIITHDTTNISNITMHPLGSLINSFTLEDLTLDARHYEITLFLRPDTPLTLSLKRLNIRLPDFTQTHVQSLISVIGANCPRLEELRLQGRPDDFRGETAAVIEFCAVKHYLMELKQMRSFAFSHIFGWRIDDSDFEEVISQWPLLEELHLLYPPSNTPTSSLQVLCALAKHCSNLCKLTLPLDLDSPASNCILSSAGGHTEHQFSDLHYLKLGTPLVAGSESKVAAIAIYLTGLCVPSSALRISHNFDDEIIGGSESQRGQQLLEDIRRYMVISSYYIRQIKRLQFRVKSLEAK